MENNRFLLCSVFSKPLRCGIRILHGVLTLWFVELASAANPWDADVQTPQTGHHALRILSPNLLELLLVNTKQPDPARVDNWDWVNDQQVFVPPDISSVKVLANGQTNVITGVGFKRRALYAPFLVWDLRIGNQLYLQLSHAIPEGAAVQVLNNGMLWPSDMACRPTVSLRSPTRKPPQSHGVTTAH